MDEAAVQVAFAQFQRVLENGEADALWGSTDSDTHEAAERAAKRLRADAEKLTPQEREKKAKELGLSAAELATLTGKRYLTTPLFRKKKPLDEIPGSKFLSASVQGDKAVAKYKESDGDEEKMTFTKEGDLWKASVAVE
jgi:hypothetical protein